MPLTITKTNQDQLLETALELTQGEGWKADAVAFAARRQGSDQPCAIAVFQDFTARTAEFHMAFIGEKTSSEVLDAFKTIAFHPQFLNLKRVYAHVGESNKAAQIVALKSGFDFEFRKRGSAAGGEDAIIFSITPETSGQATARPHTQTASP